MKGMLSHSFDRFYVVTKFELPKVEDLKLTTIDFNSKCSYLSRNDSFHAKLIKDCLNIIPYMEFYKQQIAYYNETTYNILAKEIALILPKFPENKRQKRGTIIASVLGGIVSRVHCTAG